MKKILALFVMLLSVSGCLSQHYLEYQGVKLRTVAAFEAFPGMIGLKTTEWKNGFDFQLNPKIKNVEAVAISSARITALITRSLELTAEGSYVKNGNVAAGNMVYQKGNYVLMSVVSRDELALELNKPEYKHVIDVIASDPDYRIVTGIVTVSEHADFESGGFRGMLNGIGIASTKGSASASRRFDLHDGNTVAYYLGRFCWAKDGSKHLIAIVRDDIGWDSGRCPDNSTSSPPMST